MIAERTSGQKVGECKKGRKGKERVFNEFDDRWGPSALPNSEEWRQQKSGRRKPLRGSVQTRFSPSCPSSPFCLFFFFFHPHSSLSGRKAQPARARRKGHIFFVSVNLARELLFFSPSPFLYPSPIARTKKQAATYFPLLADEDAECKSMWAERNAR